MDSMDKEVNKIIMQELGLEPSSNNCMIDQDTGMAIIFRGMNVTAPGTYGGRNSIEFDPHNNKKLMNALFGHFLNKYEYESDVSVSTYFDVDVGNNKSVLQVRMDDDTCISSKPYLRSSLRCIDIISQLNGEEAPDLSQYDIAETFDTVRRKRGTANGKNSSKSKTTRNRKQGS